MNNWTLSTNDKCDIEFDLPDESSSTNLDFMSNNNESRSLHQIVSDATDNVKTDTKNFNIVDSLDSTVNGSSAHIIVYTWHNKGESDTQKAMEILILNDNRSYDITYSPDTR